MALSDRVAEEGNFMPPEGESNLPVQDQPPAAVPQLLPPTSPPSAALADLSPWGGQATLSAWSLASRLHLGIVESVELIGAL